MEIKRVASALPTCATSSSIGRVASTSTTRYSGGKLLVRRIAAALLGAAVFAVLALPAAAAPTAVLAPIAAWVKAANAGDRAGVIATFTADATIVDEFAPYRFPAPAAAAHWYDGFVADSTANNETDGLIVTKPPKFINVTGVHAWVTVPTVYTYEAKGVPEKETGSLVFTLLRTGTSWKITTMAWALLTDSTQP